MTVYAEGIMSKSLAGLIITAGVLFAQTTPQFEVASIKPAGSITAQAASGKLHVGMNIDAARVDIGSMSLMELICKAYDVKPHQVSGPDWMRSARFDILAKMPEGASKDQVPQMLQGLLTDRFKLTFHRDNKEQPIYALVVGKGGPKLKESPAETAPAPAADDEKKDKSAIVIGSDKGPVSITRDGQGAVVKGGPMGTTRVSMGPNGAMHMEADRMTMSGFADMLSRFTDHPVIDMTELTGTYQVAIDVSMDEIRNAARAAGMTLPPQGPGGAEAGKPPSDAASDPTGTSLYATVQQLGLKLEARKSALGMLVVDHAEKLPTEN
jgi:uncharacterized protein (TIGR03435 family)